MSGKDMIKTLICFRGIGEAKAKALIDAGFDSVEKIRKSSIKDLAKVPGISESIAKSLYTQIQKEKPSAHEKKKEKTITSKKTEEKEVEHLLKSSSEKTVDKPLSKKKPTIKKEEYEPNKKPILSDEIQLFLSFRKKLKKRTPNFYREEWFRYKRLEKSWRRPDGITSKMRRKYKYRPNKVRVGYRGPKKARDLHPSGFEEIMVFSLADIEAIDPKTQAARIGGSVGMRKRLQLEEKAKELDIRVLNKQRRFVL